MFEYEKPYAEVIEIVPFEQITNSFGDEDEDWGDNEDWP